MKKISLVFFWLLLSADTRQPPVKHYTAASLAKESAVIYLINHGWHTGFIVPAQALQNRFPLLKKRFATAAYFEIGWGDKGFYQAKEVTTQLTLQAMFYSSGSVVQVVAVPEKVNRYFHHSQVEKLCLSPEKYAALLRFIAAGFATNSQGEVIALQKGRYGNSQFFAGSGTYHLFQTCNKWVAQGLQQAGLKIDPTFNLTASSVLDALQAQTLVLGTQHCHYLAD